MSKEKVIKITDGLTELKNQIKSQCKNKIKNTKIIF